MNCLPIYRNMMNIDDVAMSRSIEYFLFYFRFEPVFGKTGSKRVFQQIKSVFSLKV